MTPLRPLPPAIRLRCTWLAAVAGCALTGLGIARLTLGLNPHLGSSRGDLLWLHVDFIVVYALAGALLGIPAAAIAALVRQVAPGSRRGRRIERGWSLSVFLAPLAYLALLPDLGWEQKVLGHFVGASAWRRAWMAGIFGATLLAAGQLIGPWLERIGARRGRLAFPAAVVAIASVLVGVLPVGEGSKASPPPIPSAPVELSRPDELPHRVVLLCIDGADPDVILPMVAAGELPTFARMLEEGTWGPLETLSPTLSPVIWTTIATGKSPSEHGIHQFLFSRLPGVDQAIYQFPLHTGWNFELFPLLERIPGMPTLRAPYSSEMRRADALWEIVGRLHPVGLYRWLLSWPAEEVNGFAVAGGIAWARIAPSVHPPELRLMRPERRGLTPEEIVAFAGAGVDVGRGDPRLRPARTLLLDPTARELPFLIERFDARFTAAAFYPVDAFHHLFHDERDRGGPFSDAISAAYRVTDARLGELLDSLGDATRVIVVSDHGFDFEHGHHTHAPPGIFLARGPGFEAGRRVDGLSVYDVAPMVLHLLEMPLPDDMPGVRSGDYRRALSPELLDTVEPEHVATYERAAGGSHESMENQDSEAIKEVLKSLGYID